MALELLTAGITVKYAVESTAGSRPTSGYTVIPGVKSIPEFGNDAPTVETTTLANLVSKSYIPSLKDPGGAVSLTVNDTEAFRDAWDTMMTAYATAKASGLGLWVEYAYPTGSDFDSFYYPAEPTAYGFGGADVDEVIENAASFIPVGDFLFASAST